MVAVKPKDIRLDLGFFRNRKTVKTIRAIGAEGLLAIVRLWIYAAEFHPDGVLEGLDDDDLEAVGEWPCGAHAERMRPALTRLGWLNSDTKTLHDWDEHQAWIVGGPERSRLASEAAKAKYKRSKRRASGRQARRKRTASRPDSPISNPNPNPVGGLEAETAAHPDGVGASALPNCKNCHAKVQAVTPDGLCMACVNGGSA